MTRNLIFTCEFLFSQWFRHLNAHQSVLERILFFGGMIFSQKKNYQVEMQQRSPFSNPAQKKCSDVNDDTDILVFLNVCGYRIASVGKLTNLLFLWREKKWLQKPLPLKEKKGVAATFVKMRDLFSTKKKLWMAASSLRKNITPMSW